MNWIHFTRLNGSALYLRKCDIYKVVVVKSTKQLHVYTVQGFTYECEGMPQVNLLNLLEDDK